MRKRLILGVAILIAVIGLSSFGSRNYAGTYTGYSWRGESKGVSLEDATQKIETVLVLDEKGTIVDASINFMKLNKGGVSWYNRNDPSATVLVDFSVEPTLATPQDEGQDYSAGDSMFTIRTNDMMSLYVVAVDEEGALAFGLVDPIHRYLLEIKLESGFDFSQSISTLTIGSGLLVPTIRTSTSGYLKPTNWQDYTNTNLFGFYSSPYVYTGRGIFQGLDNSSTVEELLVKAGVSFENGEPLPMEATHGFYANGGWSGNYAAMEEFLIGKKATKLTSLINWSIPRYNRGVNDDNFFGVDSVSGATRTVQNSTDGIAGATVRISREATSYQRALVDAGILEEEDVIKGRF